MTAIFTWCTVAEEYTRLANAIVPTNIVFGTAML
jgi:hypothetical protein